MPSELLPDFLFTHGLNFWEYGLNREQSEMLAEKYL